MKTILLAALITLAPLAAQARIINCPINGRPYDTVTGYYVDVRGTSQYVKPSNRRISPPRRTTTTYTR